MIGAFAITQDPIIIALGLGVGAMYIRSFTIYLVRKGTLSEYVYLEHGAMWAIGGLATILLVTIKYHVPELVTGGIGLAFIGTAIVSSVIYKRRNPECAGGARTRAPCDPHELTWSSLMAIDYSKRPSKPAAEPAAASAPRRSPASRPPHRPRRPPSAPVSLGKVTLTKSAPSVSLTKGGATGDAARQPELDRAPRRPAGAPPEEKKGFLKKLQAAAEQRMNTGAIDLDLACLYEYTDGSKGVVQALGNAFRDKHTFGADPICWLDGDDRSGTATGGENLFVNLAHAAAIRRVLVFAFIYQGVPNWAAADAVVTLFPAEGGQIEVRLDEADNQSPLCSIAMLTNDGSGIKVNREIRYIRGSQSALDKEYGWGMNWARGSK